MCQWSHLYLYIIVFYLKKNRMARCHAPFSWRHAPFSEHHAPFDKKKTWHHVLPMCPFSFLQTIRNIAWSKGDNSSELSNFDAIVKIKNADCRQRKRKREEMRKTEAASCRNLMKFFSRYIKCFSRHKIVWTCNEVSIFNQHSSAVMMFTWAW